MVTITTPVIKAYIVARQTAGAKHGTINRELQILKRAFKLAQEAQQLAMMPVIKKLDEPKQPRKGFFERPEFEAVRDRLPVHLRGLLTLFCWTGWRLSEVLGLQVRQVNIAQGVMTLDAEQCKNDDGREFHFGPLLDLHTALSEQLSSAERIGRETSKIVLNVFHQPDGSAIKPSEWRKAWEAARTAAGYPTKKVHDFRRTAARNLERAGVSRTVAMAMIGHKIESI
jgi:integrase